MKAGGDAAEGAAANVGVDAWKRLQALWHRLRPAVETRPAALEAVGDVAQNPEDGDALAALRVQIRKILEADGGLARDVAQMLEEMPAGARTVYVGGDVTQSTIVAGDRNTIVR